MPVPPVVVPVVVTLPIRVALVTMFHAPRFSRAPSKLQVSAASKFVAWL